MNKDYIHEALNQLIIDDDPSISYGKSSISSKTDFYSIDDLYQTYKENPENLFDITNTACISIILDNGDELSLHEYQKNNTYYWLDKKIFKISDKQLNEDIYFGFRNAPVSNIQWQDVLYHPKYSHEPNRYEPLYWKLPKYEQMDRTFICEMLSQDMDGITNTENTFRGRSVAYGLVDYAIDIPIFENVTRKQKLYAKRKKYYGYIPSVGQMMFLFKYADMLNYIFEKIYASSLKIDKELYYWTSNEFSGSLACAVRDGKIMFINKTNNTERFAYMPFFTKKKYGKSIF